MNWKKQLLSNLIEELSSGGRPKGGAITTNGVPSIGAEHLNDEGGFDFTKIKYIPYEYYSLMGRGKISNNDILIVKDGATTGKVSFVNGTFPFTDAAINEHVFRLRVKNKLLYPKYCFYYLFSELGQREVLSDFRGATVGGISKSFTDFVEIPLPEIAIQERICSILDEADALQKADKQLIANYNDLLKASFLKTFGDPVNNHKKWEIVLFKDIILDVVAGCSLGGEERELSEDELGVLKVSAVTQGYFKSDEYKAVKKSEIKRKLITPQKGNLLFSRANTRDLVGATCIVDNDYPKLFLPDKIWRIDPNLAKCNQYYLKFLLSHSEFRYNLTKTATGTSGSMLNISMEKLKALIIPLPPLKIQNHFAEIVKEIEQQIVIVKAQRKKSEALFQSLLQKAFMGELC